MQDVNSVRQIETQYLSPVQTTGRPLTQIPSLAGTEISVATPNCIEICKLINDINLISLNINNS
jgi:hypothetical protein